MDDSVRRALTDTRDEVRDRRESVVRTTCLADPSDAVVTAFRHLSAAAAALLRHDDHDARHEVLGIDRAALWAHWFAASSEWQARHDAGMHAGRTEKPPPPSRSVVRAVFDRDGWTCRYCRTPVINSAALRLIGRLLPDALAWGDRTGNSHPATWLLVATPDHVAPRATGGSSDLDNLVTACGTCQYSKGSCSITELGLIDPREVEPPTTDWDGLSGAVPELSTLPQPVDTPQPCVDFDLEYLVAHGRHTSRLPAIKDPNLVFRLVDLYERSIAGSTTPET